MNKQEKREAIEEALGQYLWAAAHIVGFDALAKDAIVIRMNVEYDKEAFTGKPMTYIEEDGGVQSLWVCGHKLPPGKAIAIIIPGEEK